MEAILGATRRRAFLCIDKNREKLENPASKFSRMIVLKKRLPPGYGVAHSALALAAFLAAAGSPNALLRNKRTAFRNFGIATAEHQ
jgi:hypothetical protein